MKVRPLHDRLLVRRAPEKEQKKGGSIIPDTAKEKPQEGEGVAGAAALTSLAPVRYISSRSERVLRQRRSRAWTGAAPRPTRRPSEAFALQEHYLS